MRHLTSQQLGKDGFDLDALLEPAPAAAWLRMAERTLLANARAGKIPVVKINDRVLRFHPRSILAATTSRGKAMA
jgi:hypothetical protein